MNLNHDHDQHLLNAIDKRLSTTQPIGDTVIDALAHTRPIPREAFQQQLESQLLTRVETRREGETVMTSTSGYLPVETRRHGWLPLTLVAAMLVVVVAGSLFLSGRKPPINEVSLAQQVTTATTPPTAPTDVPILAANLPVDRAAVEIPLTSLSTDSLAPEVGSVVDILALLPFAGNRPNFEGIPATALPDGTRLIENFVAFNAVVLAQAEGGSTITVSVPADQGRLLAWLVEQSVTLRLQEPMNNRIANLGESRVVEMPIENVVADDPIQAGDAVNIYATCTFAAVFGVVSTVDCEQAPVEIQAEGVVVFGALTDGEQPRVNTKTIGIAVSPDVYDHLAGLTIGGMRFKLVKADEASSEMVIPAGKVAISLPMTGVKIPDDEPIAVGDTVDVITSYLYVDIGDAPSEFQQVITPESEQDVTAKNWTTRVAKGALILQIDEAVQPQGFRTVSLAVTPEEATVLQWASEMNNPIILRTRSGDTPPASPYSLQLTLNSLSNWTSDALEVGDSIDMVMGFVLGDDEQIALNYVPYATATWGDTISQGEISAQIYAPTSATPTAGSAFIRRMIDGALITSMRVSTDAQTGRLSDVIVVLEMPAGTMLQDVDTIKGYIAAGMPYLLVAR